MSNSQTLIPTRLASQIRVTAFTLIAFLAMFALIAGDALAQKKRRNIPLVRDAEIEGLLKDYTTPIFKAAGLRTKSIDVYLVNKPDFNAFVTGKRMFINLGAIQTAETPNEIIGVIAHETGHIVGGHLHRLRERVERAQVMAVLGMLAGVGAAVAGGEAGDAASGALIHGSRDAFMRSILAYQRDEERAADRTAFTLMEKTGQSSKGLIATFKRFSRSLNLSTNQNPYLVSHPLPRERIQLMQTIAQQSRFYDRPDSESLQFRHDMARAKIAAYSERAGAVQRLFARRLNSPAALYGDAISTYLSGSPRQALTKINALIKRFPKIAYLHEMKGEILLSAGKARDAIGPYEKAIKLDKYRTGIIRIQLGHAILETNDKKQLPRAIKELKLGVARDPTTSQGYEYLARAYSASGRQNLAIAAAAEHNFAIGRYKKANAYARRAQQKLKRGSPQWLRLEDIIRYKPPKKKKF